MLDETQNIAGNMSWASLSPSTAGTAVSATQGTLLHWSGWRGTVKDQISYMLGFQSVLQGLQASKLQMGNSFRRLLIREGWKSLIPDQISHAQEFVFVGFCCYWYSDQLSPVAVSALNFSWDIKPIESPP